jgi:hypothetical protein
VVHDKLSRVVTVRENARCQVGLGMQRVGATVPIKHLHQIVHSALLFSSHILLLAKLIPAMCRDSLTPHTHNICSAASLFHWLSTLHRLSTPVC